MDTACYWCSSCRSNFFVNHWPTWEVVEEVIGDRTYFVPRPIQPTD